MEVASKENIDTVRRVWKYVFQARQDGGAVTEDQRLIYEVETLSMEVNSGASFEQFFRFARVEEISRIVVNLEKFELFEVSKLTKQAIEMAYPSGIPRTDDEKSYLPDWADSQAAVLRDLGARFTDYNGRIMNTLAEYTRQVGA